MVHYQTLQKHDISIFDDTIYETLFFFLLHPEQQQSKETDVQRLNRLLSKSTHNSNTHAN